MAAAVLKEDICVNDMLSGVDEKSFSSLGKQFNKEMEDMLLI